MAILMNIPSNGALVQGCVLNRIADEFVSSEELFYNLSVNKSIAIKVK